MIINILELSWVQSVLKCLVNFLIAVCLLVTFGVSVPSLLGGVVNLKFDTLFVASSADGVGLVLVFVRSLDLWGSLERLWGLSLNG